MKKSGIAALLALAAALLLTFTACAENGDETTPQDPPISAAEPQTPAVLTPEEQLAAAKDFIDAPVEDLIAKIGEPESRDYAPSCIGKGDDGNLYYDGFIVYTYREDGKEVVIDVE